MFNSTVAWITLRATMSRKRALLFALPAVILIVVTLLLKISKPASRPWPSHVLGTFGFTVLLPLTALIIGTSVLGAMLFAAVPELIAALISGGGSTPDKEVGQNGGVVQFVQGTAVSNSKFAIGLFVGALVGAVIYNALFVMVSVATTRAIAVGLLYVLIWESLLSNFVSGARLRERPRAERQPHGDHERDHGRHRHRSRPSRRREPLVQLHPQGRPGIRSGRIKDRGRLPHEIRGVTVHDDARGGWVSASLRRAGARQRGSGRRRPRGRPRPGRRQDRGRCRARRPRPPPSR
jgi:ABC-2 type transport system permease protein